MAVTEEVRFIPPTKMGERYIAVQAQAPAGTTWSRGERTRCQRKQAERDRSDVEHLVADFLSSVAEFERYRPREKERFYESRPPLGDAWREPGKPVTDRIAARMQDAGVEFGGRSFLRYLDREIVPSRTTSPFERSEGTFVRLDLLLAVEKTPIVAEVKALSDENAYYALIQGLTACAQLSTPAQRKRLADQYKDKDLSKSEPLQFLIILSEHNSRGEDKAAMLDLSYQIANGLIARPDFARFVSTIRCLDATIPAEGPVELIERWSALAPD